MAQESQCNVYVVTGKQGWRETVSHRVPQGVGAAALAQHGLVDVEVELVRVGPAAAVRPPLRPRRAPQPPARPAAHQDGVHVSYHALDQRGGFVRLQHAERCDDDVVFFLKKPG